MEDLLEGAAELLLAIFESSPKAGCAIVLLIGAGITIYYFW